MGFPPRPIVHIAFRPIRFEGRLRFGIRLLASLLDRLLLGRGCYAILLPHPQEARQWTNGKEEQMPSLAALHRP